jgi:hypothetical protein
LVFGLEGAVLEFHGKLKLLLIDIQPRFITLILIDQQCVTGAGDPALECRIDLPEGEADGQDGQQLGEA